MRAGREGREREREGGEGGREGGEGGRTGREDREGGREGRGGGREDWMTSGVWVVCFSLTDILADVSNLQFF